MCIVAPPQVHSTVSQNLQTLLRSRSSMIPGTSAAIIDYVSLSNQPLIVDPDLYPTCEIFVDSGKNILRLDITVFLASTS